MPQIGLVTVCEVCPAPHEVQPAWRVGVSGVAGGLLRAGSVSPGAEGGPAPPAWPPALAAASSQILFETFSVPALYVANPGVLSLYASGQTSGEWPSSQAPVSLLGKRFASTQPVSFLSSFMEVELVHSRVSVSKLCTGISPDVWIPLCSHRLDQDNEVLVTPKPVPSTPTLPLQSVLR